MPTKRIMVLAGMVFVGGTLTMGAVRLWSAKTLATKQSGIAFRAAEIGALL